MIVNTDLHSHSGASGGVGDVSLEQIATTMGLKGIDVFGTGDCIHDGWLEKLEASLEPAENGLYKLTGFEKPRFMAQTEVILTAPVPCGGRKSVHTVLLFPSFAAAKEAAKLCDKWGVKRNIGRPWITCESSEEVAEKLIAIRNIDESIEIIPAHVLTPQGIYGSNSPVDSMKDFFGEATNLIKAVETGLSADPLVLALIPELDDRTLISCSDCHCGALNRVGREYTSFDCDELSYEAIIKSLRARKVKRTAEFSPAEGRYFLTGHRAGKRGHENGQFCFFSPDTVPENNICPVCGKELTVGVLQRALELSRIQGQSRTIENVTPKQDYISMVPLTEVIAAGLKVKNSSSKKVTAIYHKIVTQSKSETAFWEMAPETAIKIANDDGGKNVAEAVKDILENKYTFAPLGYDGTYGQLTLGEAGQWFGYETIHGEGASNQKTLF